MPDPEKIVRIILKAREATLATPGRTGRLIHLDADDVFVAGDLHGNVAHFRQILNRADLKGHPRRHLVMQELIHGPFMYDGGGDKSHQLLDLFAALKCQYPSRVHFLPGNHEFAQVTGRPIARSAGEMNTLFRRGVDVAYRDLADAIYREYVQLIFASPLALRTANRVFISHSVPPLKDQSRWRSSVLTNEQLNIDEYEPSGAVYPLVWGRDVSTEAAEGFRKLIDADWLITGHLPCEEGFQTPNDRQIVLDSQQPPAACCLFSANGPIDQETLVRNIIIL